MQELSPRMKTSPFDQPFVNQQVAWLSPGIRLNRDNRWSIAYSEELISSKISATLQSTDRHHGIVGQERCHFQLAS